MRTCFHCVTQGPYVEPVLAGLSLAPRIFSHLCHALTCASHVPLAPRIFSHLRLVEWGGLEGCFCLWAVQYSEESNIYLCLVYLGSREYSSLSRESWLLDHTCGASKRRASYPYRIVPLFRGVGRGRMATYFGLAYILPIQVGLAHTPRIQVGWVGWVGHIERKIASVVHSHPPSHYIRAHALG